MDPEVVWSFSATADLESIIEYIFRDSEFYAATVTRELVRAARSLATFSERGRMVPEYAQRFSPTRSFDESAAMGG